MGWGLSSIHSFNYRGVSLLSPSPSSSEGATDVLSQNMLASSGTSCRKALSPSLLHAASTEESIGEELMS